jgi:hypothetical protein
MEAASCVEIAVLDLISQVELRRVSLFARDGRPTFALSGGLELPQWWHDDTTEGSYRGGRAVSTAPAHHPRSGVDDRGTTEMKSNQPPTGPNSARPSHHQLPRNSRGDSIKIGGVSHPPQHHTTTVNIPPTPRNSSDARGVVGERDVTEGGGSRTTSVGDSVAFLGDVYTDDGSIQIGSAEWCGTDAPGPDSVGGEDGEDLSALAYVSSGGSRGGAEGAISDFAADTNPTGIRSPFSPSFPQQIPSSSGRGTPFYTLLDPRRAKGPTGTNAARYYFLNPRISEEVFYPQEFILKLGDESSLYHFLPPKDEGGLSVRAGRVLVGVIITVFLLWTLISLVLLLTRPEREATSS